MRLPRQVDAVQRTVAPGIYQRMSAVTPSDGCVCIRSINGQCVPDLNRCNHGMRPTCYPTSSGGCSCICD